MPKLIPEGGKRDIQLKVHLNKPEKYNLENLTKFYGTSDRASALRKLLANWVNLHEYVSSFNEIILIAKDIYDNKEELKLTRTMTEKVLDIIEIGEKLSSDSFTNKYNVRFNHPLVKANTLENSDKRYEVNSKIIILKLFDLAHIYNILDHLLNNNTVICSFNKLKIECLEDTQEFTLFIKVINAINANYEKLSDCNYLFTTEKIIIENEKYSKISIKEDSKTQINFQD